jgi:3-hydroxyisobutyrate dehydrogenase
MSSSYSAVGFIGLGTMGYPMVENLVKKLPPPVKIFVFDVVNDAVQKITTANKERVYACKNSKEVADNSVSIRNPN